MNKLSAIAFVPARRNSKRLPGKNKIPLNGKPLFMYSVEAALNSNCYQMVVVSTDDEDILEMAKEMDGVTVVERPNEYATDDVRAKDVILYHLGKIGIQFSYVSLLMPTSPFRDAGDICETFEIIQKVNGTSIASVVEYDVNPRVALSIMGDQVYSYFDREFNWERETEFEKAYHLNGAIFTSKADALIKTGSFVQNGTFAYIMDPIRSLDIDDEVDFKYAEFILKENLL